MVDLTFLNYFRDFWYLNKPPAILGVLFLLGARIFLYEHNLHDYNQGLVLFTGPCTPAETEARTLDGHCNSLSNPTMGMVNTRFGRQTEQNPATAIDKNTPDPYLVASKLLLQREGSKGQARVEGVNLLAAGWIQYQIHDWFSHAHDTKAPPIRIQVDEDTKYSKTYYNLPATAKDSAGHSRNQLSTWWDASQIYGLTSAELASVRSGGSPSSSKKKQPDACLLPFDEQGHLPLGPDGVPVQGFTRNWWVGLELMHAVWVKEHNAICKELARSYPTMSSKKRFNVARMVNAALQAKVHTIEWTPALLQNDALNMSMHSNWYGLPPTAFKTLVEILSKDANYAQLIPSLMPLAATPGLSGVGSKTYDAGVPMSISEDFVSAYRLHQLLPDTYKVGNKEVKLINSIFKETRKIVKKYGYESLTHAFGYEHPGALILNNYPQTLARLNLPEDSKNQFLNMAVVDIVRDRERNVPRYNEVRKQLGLAPLKSFEDLTKDPKALATLKSVYANVDQIDFQVGAVAEDPRPAGYGFGVVQFYIFIALASRRLLTDRFLQESFNAEIYTEVGLNWVQKNTFRSVLIRHYPALEQSIGSQWNAFLPWNGQSKAPCAVTKNSKYDYDKNDDDDDDNLLLREQAVDAVQRRKLAKEDAHRRQFERKRQFEELVAQDDDDRYSCPW